MRPPRPDAQRQDRVRPSGPPPAGAHELSLTDVLFGAAVAALVIPLLVGLRRRIFVRMAFRNTMRRKRQSLMIMAGLMVGTAIVASAQVAGDSMGYSIRKATLDAFEEIDQTVFLDGYNFFPRGIETALRRDTALRDATDAIGSNVIWDVAVTAPRTGQYEPSARLLGFDPATDREFGVFRTDQGPMDGTTLGPRDAILSPDLAKALNARRGDTIRINYTLPQDPVLPSIYNFTGILNLSATPPALPLNPGPVEPVPATIRIRVTPGATGLAIALFWIPGDDIQQDLDLVLTSPSGRTYANRNGTTNAPDIPSSLFVNGTLARPLEGGDWTLRVHGKAAVQTRFFGSAVTLHPIYDLDELDRLVRALQEQHPYVDPTQFTEPPRRTAEFSVVAVTQGGKGPNFQLPNRQAIYVRMDTSQQLLERPDQVNFVKISNPGDREAGVLQTSVVYPLLWERLNATKTLFPDDASVQALRANNDKEFWLAEAERTGELFGVFLTFVGSFSIIAGLLLIINIFTMLAEERKVELAMARAVGLRRNHLVQLFTFEGVFYALPAAILGVIAGLGLATLLIWGFNLYNTQALLPPIPFRLEWESLRFAFAVGILLTVATVYLGARRASRLNIVAAIRNLDEPPHLRGIRTLVGTALVTAIGLAGTYFALVADSVTWRLFGPTFLALGIALILRRYAKKERVFPLIALGLFAYLTFLLFFVNDPDTEEAQIMRPLRSVAMTLCIVVFVVYTDRLTRLFGRLIAYIRPLRPVALPAVSYPLHKKFRTGMTLAMFSVILLVVMLFSIFGALFAPDVDKERGGYDIEARSGQAFATLDGLGADPTLLDEIEYYDVLPYFTRFGADIVTISNQSTGQFGPPANLIFGIDDDFAKRNEFQLLRRDPAYASDRDAYRAVAANDRLVIVAYPYSTDAEGRDNAHGPGDILQLRAKAGVREFRVVGVQEQFHFQGIFIQKKALQTLFPNPDTLVLFRIQDPDQHKAMAQRIEANYQDVGLDAESIRVKILEENEVFNQIFTLIRLFLSLGLIVGILSLGIVTARSVIERRQEIGMMRALGYLRRHIRRTFLLEMLTTVALGIVIGTAVAILVSYAIWLGQVRELRLPYVLPVLELVTIALIAFVATTLSTLGPILRAARTPPAEALRYIE